MNTNTHQLTFDTPTPREWSQGALSDLIAQCSCGSFEYVYSRTEGAYWHSLHIAQPHRHGHHLMLDAPMPAGWTTPVEVATVALVVGSQPARTYACRTCKGACDVAAYGALDGRFCQHGERRACGDCGGTGRTLTWAAS